MGINDSSSVLAATSATTNASFTETADAAAGTATAIATA